LNLLPTHLAVRLEHWEKERKGKERRKERKGKERKGKKERKEERRRKKNVLQE